MITVPCMKCENRGCGTYHDVCPEYLEYKKVIQNEKDEKRKKVDVECIKRKLTRQMSTVRTPQNSPLRMHKR